MDRSHRGARGQDRGQRQTWNRLSRHYDRQLRLERSAVAFAVELLAPDADERCLDVGTGTGEFLRALARSRYAPRTAVGVDSSSGMLARAKVLPTGWTVHLADARQLPFDDGSFDAASASYLLHVLSEHDRLLVLAEIRRVLRPGGRLVTVTPAIPPDGLARPVAQVLDWLARRGRGRYRGLLALNPARDLERAGFTVLRSLWSTRGYPSVCLLARRSG